MDKYEYKVRSDEIARLIDEEKYEEAAAIADTIDWRRVKSITMLLRIAALYRVNRRNEDSRAVLLLAYERYPGNRSVVYYLCEVSIELDDVVAAIEYYKEFVKVAPRDNGVFTLRYRILEAQEASLEERIELLEELKKRDYQEEWAYELAYLYHRVGLATKCIEECDDLILWFGDGPYVMKAMELKMLHIPLTAIQEKKYNMMRSELQGIPEEESYADDQYGQAEYDQSEYSDEAYEQETYSSEEYEQGEYEEGEYAEETYAQSEYEQGYSQEEYAQADYADEAYPTQMYTSEEVYSQESNQQDGSLQSEYYEQAPLSEEIYEQEAENTQESASIGNAYKENNYADMSQYNTINLQKVVAESMRELFPDDEDIYAENRREVEQIESSAARFHMKEAEKDEEYHQQELPGFEDAKEEQDTVKSYVGHVTSMITGVTEAMPEPQSGAIKRVIIPGDDARSLIRDEANIQTEANNEDEQGRENRYSFDLEEEKEPFRPMTGQMNIEDVLTEWERMKKENEEKRKEEVRQLVLQQTGQLFENFDQSIKTGILGEISEVELENDTDSTMRTEVFIEDDEVEELEEIESDSEDMAFEEYAEDETADETAFEEIQPMYESLDMDAEVDAEYAGQDEATAETDIEEYEVQDDEVAESDTEANEVQDDEAAESDIEGYEVQDDEAETDVEADTEEYEAQDEEIAETDEETDTEEVYEAQEEAVTEAETDAEEEVDESVKAITQQLSMNTAEISSLPDKIIAATKRETKGIKKEQIRDFTEDEKELFENYAVNHKVKKQIIYALEHMSLAAFTGNVIVTGEPGLGTVRISKNLIREFKDTDANFSGKLAKIKGKQLNTKSIKEVLEKLQNGALVIEEANGLTEQTLYEIAKQLNREDLGIILFMVDTKKNMNKMLEKQTMIADYFNIRIDLIEMDNDALVDYAKNYAQALEYSIDDLGMLALYTRIANIQSGNHVVTKDEVRDIVDEAIGKSKKFKFKNFVDVLFSKRYDAEDMIVLKERDFM